MTIYSIIDLIKKHYASAIKILRIDIKPHETGTTVTVTTMPEWSGHMIRICTWECAHGSNGKPAVPHLAHWTRTESFLATPDVPGETSC